MKKFCGFFVQFSILLTTLISKQKLSKNSWKFFAAFLSNFLFCWQLWFPVPDKNCPNIREIFLQFFLSNFHFNIFLNFPFFFSIFNFVRIFNFHFVQSCKNFSRILDNFCLEIKIVNKIKNGQKSHKNIHDFFVNKNSDNFYPEIRFRPIWGKNYLSWLGSQFAKPHTFQMGIKNALPNPYKNPP